MRLEYEGVVSWAEAQVGDGERGKVTIECEERGDTRCYDVELPYAAAIELNGRRVRVTVETVE